MDAPINTLNSPLPIHQRSPRWRWMMGVTLWLLAMVLAFAADGPAAHWVHQQGWDIKAHWSQAARDLAYIVKLPGNYVLVLAVAAALWLLHPWSWRAAAFLALAGAASGINRLIKWIAGRHRPITGIHPFAFNPFQDGWRGLFEAKNLCFTSGHACLAFASATALAICLPRWRYLFFAIAVIVGIERFVENAHYLSDIVGGAGLGIVLALGARWILGNTSAKLTIDPTDAK